ncbi:MAG: T9SS type A sorting domain-containing protein [Flavobacteriales bacterium]|nr:T9SS type A sorting domain-containing protein [Flavobacteriales bacterium]
MKKNVNLFILIYLLSCSSALAQVSKNVITEHFTNTVCSICASRNPQLNSNLVNNPSVLRISYHPSSPYASCVLSQHNVVANDTRTNAYNIYGGTPRIVIQGEVQSPSVNFSSASLFDSYQNESTFIAIDVNLDTVSLIDSIKVRVKTTTVATVPTGGETYRLYVGMAEDTVFYNAPNGENKHLNVFRTALNGNSGGSIALPTTVGDSLINEFTVAKNSGWNIKRVFAYALIQTTSNMEVVQVGSSTPIFSNTTLAVKQNNSNNLALALTNANEELVVSTKGFQTGGFYHLYHINGQLLLEGEHVNDYSRFSVSSLPKGVYVLRVGNQNGVVSKKFLK